MTQRNTSKLSVIHPQNSTYIAHRSRRKFAFTRERIAALPSPTIRQRAYYYDLKVRGLAVAVSPGGKKVFILYRLIAGRPERITIGNFLDLSVERARQEAERMNTEIALGKNPAVARRTLRDEPTLEDLFQTYLEEHAKPKKRSWRDDVSTFNCHLALWRRRKISSLRKMEVVTLHARIGRDRGHYAANRTVELLSSMLNWAREFGGWAGENVAAGVKAFPERRRERFLEADELPAFFKALAQELNVTIRDYILISLLTGARRGNVQSMRWDEISWKRATWTIPAEKSKSGDPLHVALSDIALRILETREATAASEWVFPGRGKSGHLEEPKTAWRRILKRAGLSDLRLHDLRRTLGSWQAATGASLPIIGKTLGHRSLEATAVYSHLNLDPVRAAVSRATDAMVLAAGPTGLLGSGE